MFHCRFSQDWPTSCRPGGFDGFQQGGRPADARGGQRRRRSNHAPQTSDGRDERKLPCSGRFRNRRLIFVGLAMHTPAGFKPLKSIFGPYDQTAHRLPVPAAAARGPTLVDIARFPWHDGPISSGCRKPELRPGAKAGRDFHTLPRKSSSAIFQVVTWSGWRPPLILRRGPLDVNRTHANRRWITRSCALTGNRRLIITTGGHLRTSAASA